MTVTRETVIVRVREACKGVPEGEINVKMLPYCTVDGRRKMKGLPKKKRKKKSKVS